jgi:hypothetical protein
MIGGLPMKKWLLIVLLLALSACGTEDEEIQRASGQTAVSEGEAADIALDVIKEVWQVYGDTGAEAPLAEKRERLISYMSEEVFDQVFDNPQKPHLPQLPVYTFSVHVTQSTPDSFTIEHILGARTGEETAAKQTVGFIKRKGQFVISSYQKEDITLSLTMEEAQAFLTEQGYEVVFLREGPFDALSSVIEDAYIFHDQKDKQLQFGISKKTGLFLMGIVRGATDGVADTEEETAIQEVRAKYARLFAYRLSEMDADKLSVEQRDIYNRYIIQPIEQAIDIDFNPSLTDEESNQKTKELLDQSVAGMLSEIERSLNEKEIAALQEDHAKWAAERQKYAEEMARAAKSHQTNHFHAAYKEATEDYLAYLFYEYLY